jgi:hypothetical protein
MPALFQCSSIAMIFILMPFKLGSPRVSERRVTS